MVFSAEAADWFQTLSPRDTDRVNRLVDRLQQQGSTLRRPYAARIRGSRYHDLRELRSKGSGVRILFAIDPSNTALLLVGGDKRGQWNRWYPPAIKQAEAMLAEHLETGKREGRWADQHRATGATLPARSR